MDTWDSRETQDSRGEAYMVIAVKSSDAVEHEGRRRVKGRWKAVFKREGHRSPQE